MRLGVDLSFNFVGGCSRNRGKGQGVYKVRVVEFGLFPKP